MELAQLSKATDSGEPERLADFAADSQTLSVEEFTRLHGSGFLVHHGTIGALRAPSGPQRTIAIEAPTSSTGSTLENDFLVFRVRRTERSAFPNFISVGRTKNNDIAVGDVSLSKFHAFFRETDGRMYLQDAGSRNGTFVNDEAVATKAQGDAAEIDSGAMVRFGSVEMTFFRPEAFCELVRRLSSR